MILPPKAALCLILFISLESAARQQNETPPANASERDARGDGKEILYLIPTGHDSSVTRVYLYELCRWITQTEEIRSRYSIVYVSSHMDRPLDEVRAELSEGTELRRPSERKPDNSKGKGSLAPSEAPQLSPEEQELLQRIDTASQLLSGTGPLWDIRGRLSECYSAQPESKAGPPTHPPKSTVLIAESVNLGNHGSGLSFVKVSSKPGEKAHYDFVQLSETDYLGAVRLLAASALRPKEMAAAKVDIKPDVHENYSCTSSDEKICLLQAGSVRLTISAVDSPFVLAGQVTLPRASEWDFGDGGRSQVDITETVAGIGRVEATLHFKKPGTYRLRFHVKTQISASEQVIDEFHRIFEVQTQPLILDGSSLRVAEYSGRVWGPSLWESILPKFGKETSVKQGLPKSPVSRWKLMPAADFEALAARIQGNLMGLDSPMADPYFTREWNQSLGEVIHYDSIRELLSLQEWISSGKTFIGREAVWCSKLTKAALESMPHKPSAFISTYGEARWSKDCTNILSKELKSARSKIGSYDRLQRLRLYYAGESPKYFRVIEALANRDSAEIQPSELVLRDVPFFTYQTERFQLSALTPETASVPIPVRLDLERQKLIQIHAELGMIVVLGGENNFPSAIQAYIGSRLALPMLWSAVAPTLTVRSISLEEPEYVVGLSIYPRALYKKLFDPSPADYDVANHIDGDLSINYSLKRNNFALGSMIALPLGEIFYWGVNFQLSLPGERSYFVLGVTAGVMP